MRSYFNYFTEIEEHFARKRGRNLFVSPLDWCLVEVWKESRIPLHVALRGIDRSFEAAEKRQKKPPSTLFYCHPAVMEAFQEHRAAMLGESQEESGSQAAPEGPSHSVIMEHLQALLEALRACGLAAVSRSQARLEKLHQEVRARPRMDPEELDRELVQIESLLGECLQEELEPERLKMLKAEVNEATRMYKKHLTKEMYTRLKKNHLQQRVLHEFGLPEFSLLGCRL